MRFHLLAGWLLWVSGVAVGFLVLVNYETTRCTAANPLDQWPTGTRLKCVPERINIVMLAHPRCPCTRASLLELQELSQRCGGRAAIQVLFWLPPQPGPEWKQTSLWEQALTVSGAQVHPDPSGIESRRFGAETSGQVVVYNKVGQRIFQGGITNARGRTGTSQGSAAIWNLINHDPSAQTETPVFGCPLFDSNSTCHERAQLCP